MTIGFVMAYAITKMVLETDDYIVFLYVGLGSAAMVVIFGVIRLIYMRHHK
jgi:hypothetical protein